MGSQKPVLTGANIKYLLILYELGPDGNGVRCVDVARRLGVRKPSVHTMMDTLGDLGLITKEKYGAVRLTDIGYQLALRFEMCFRSLYGKLEGVLGLPADSCKNAVFHLLAQTSGDGMAMLCKSQEMNNGNAL